MPKGIPKSGTNKGWFKKNQVPHNAGTAKKKLCKTCGKEITHGTWRRVYCSQECKLNGYWGKVNKGLNKGRKMRHMEGENNPNWKGGISEENHLYREIAKYRDWRLAVFRRDYFTCKKCGHKNGKYEYEYRELEAHHFIGVSQLIKNKLIKYIFDIRNGITLCKPCHRTITNIKRRSICQI